MDSEAMLRALEPQRPKQGSSAYLAIGFCMLSSPQRGFSWSEVKHRLCVITRQSRNVFVALHIENYPVLKTGINCFLKFVVYFFIYLLYSVASEKKREFKKYILYIFI